MGQSQSLESELLKASKNNDMKTVKKLLEKKVNPNFAYNIEDNFLDVFFDIVCGEINYDYYPIVYAAKNNNLDLVRLLLQYRAKPNCAERSGFSPLIWAAYNNNLEMVKLLVSYGADINHENIDREKALNYAVYNLNSDMVKFLAGKTTSINSYETPQEWMKRKEFFCKID